jgi:hypothetical protein
MNQKSSRRRSMNRFTSSLALGWLALMSSSSVLAQSPTINRQPVDQTVFYGDPAIFTVTASGGSPLAYQWYRNGSPIPGATTTAFTVSQVSSNDAAASFLVTVTNAAGSISSRTAKLTVDFGVMVPAQKFRLFDITDSWKYEGTGTDLGTAWRGNGYNDSLWPAGPGLLWTANTSRTSNITGGPLQTWLGQTPGALPPTSYFRTHFTNTLPASAAVSLSVSTVVDDGVVVYLNGTEAFRLGITDVPVLYSSYANRTVGDAGTEGPAVFDNTLLAAGDNVLAAEVHQANSGSSDVIWGMALDATVSARIRDTNAPTMVQVFPDAGAVVPTLSQIEVHFSEGVKGFAAGDLLINGKPATNVTQFATDTIVFDFPQPAAGLVQVSWGVPNQITDLSANSNRFAGGTFSYTLDSSQVPRSVRLNEFMAANAHTVRDEDGHYSDWVELYNSGAQTVSLGGWFLTDDPLNLTKWRIPNGVSILSKAYLLIWASGLDRTNPAAPLHTSFKLDKSAGNSLDLVFSDGTTILSSISPYPQQFDDVSYGCDRLDPSRLGYFTNATPYAANATLGPGFGPEVQFSVAGGTFQQTFTLNLSTTESNAVIHYLLVTNGTSAVVTVVPDASSPVYTGPLTIAGSVQVRTRAFSAQTGYFPGPLRNETYLQVASSAASFSSDLPIVVFHNMGAGAVAFTDDQFMTMEVFDNKNGRSSLLNPPDLVVQGYFHRRGQATFYNPKANLRVETQDAYGDDLHVELLGMPAESDWVFYGIDEFDKVLMHNPLTLELYREMGHDSSHTRYVEVFLKDDSGVPGPLISSDYNGLYVLEEKIKIGKNRVNIDKLQPENSTLPSISGGYLLSIDKSNPTAGDYLGNAWVWYLDPDFVTYDSPAQRQYIQNYFNNFYSALTGPNWTNHTSGYRPYIDLPSWIDYHLHQTFVFNADMLRISSYFYKPRDGKIIQGPLWDFDRAFADSDDGRGFNPRRWRSADGDGGTDPFNAGNTFNNPWYGVMFTDPDFWQLWIDRYQELRRSVYSLTNLMAQIDFYANQVREATAREYTRWRGSGGSDTSPRSGSYSADGLTYSFPVPGTWQGEVNFVKYWFSNRVSFIDFNFLNPPTFSTNEGPVPYGFPLTLNAPTAKTNSTIYYTLDGTDPRLPGGGVNPAALSSLNSTTLILTNNARIFARNWNADHRNITGPNQPPISSSWSGPTVATFVVGTPPLRITELMYNPPPPAPGSTNKNDDFEYIEFRNINAAALNLQGYQLSGGVDYTFGSYSLGAGQTVLLVHNLAAFQSRYPGVNNIAGTYTNNLNNQGDHLVLQGPLQEPILDFSYNDTWYPATDGLGFSLVIRDPNGPTIAWDSKEGWRPSGTLNGTPGLVDPADPGIPPVLVNEALTHTDLPMLDTIELFNPTANPVDLGGWFLTDDRKVPKKYRISADTQIGPQSYLTFTTNQFAVGTNGFELSSIGEEVYLFSGDAGTNLTGYAHGYDFGAAPNGVSFGRYVNSLGSEQFVLQSQNTLGGTNAYPKVGPVVISEIMYHPPDPYAGMNDSVNEYVQLWNTAQTNVPLFDPNASTNTWRLRNAVDFDFPTNLTLVPGGRLLVVGFDPVGYPATLAAFQKKYALDLGTIIVGPWSGNLNNGGEKLELRRPDNPNLTPTNIFVPYYLVEEVAFNNSAPWPIDADGSGSSLQRINRALFANDPANWLAAPPFSGTPVPPAITLQPLDTTLFHGATATLTTAAVGNAPLAYQWYFNRTNAVPGATSTALVIPNAQLSNSGSYQVVVTNSVGSATSRVALVTVYAEPSILSQPTDQRAAAGGNARFDVTASGSAPLSFQWYYNTNTPLAATGPSLALSGVSTANSGSYHVVVGNSYGSVTSQEAYLTILSPPSVGVSDFHLTANGVSLSLPSVPGVSYRLEYKDSLTDVNWTPVLPPVLGTGAVIVLSDTTKPSLSSRFYRVNCY